MKILFLSGANREFDGRSTALLHILKSFSEVICMSPSEDAEYRVADPKVSILRFILDVKKACKNMTPVDVIFVDNRVTTLAVLFSIKKNKYKCLVYDARELYFFEEVEGLKSKLGCLIEKKVIEKSDLVICANEERKEIMQTRYKSISQILVFENFRKLSFSQNEYIKNKALYGHIFNHRLFTIISTSGCDLTRETLKLLEAVRQLEINCQLLLVGCVDNSDKKITENYIEKYKMNNVVMIPRVSLSVIQYLISQSDLGIAMYHKKNANNLYCSSGKIYEYVYEGIPVATTDNPTLLNFTNTYRVGFSCNNIKESIEKCYYNYKMLTANVKAFRNKNIIEMEQEKFARDLEYTLKKFLKYN